MDVKDALVITVCVVDNDSNQVPTLGSELLTIWGNSTFLDVGVVVVHGVQHTMIGIVTYAGAYGGPVSGR